MVGPELTGLGHGSGIFNAVPRNLVVSQRPQTNEHARIVPLRSPE